MDKKKEGPLEYYMIEMGSGSTAIHTTDWSSDHLIITRQNCTEEWFNFIYRFPAYIGPFVFKWRDSHYSQINIMGSHINKPDPDTLIIMEPQFIPIYDILTMVEKVEESRIFLEKHRVD